MGTGSDWHWALECSPLLINHNQSSAITSIFLGQLLRRSGGAASLREPVVCGHGRNIWRATPGRENKNKMVTRKKKTRVHLNPSRRPTLRDGISLIIYRLYCVLPVSTNRRVSTLAHGETCNLFSSVKMKSRYTKTIHGYDYGELRCKTPPAWLLGPSKCIPQSFHSIKGPKMKILFSHKLMGIIVSSCQTCNIS